MVGFFGKWEVHIPITKDEFNNMARTVLLLENAGYTATRPYEPKMQADVDGTFIRYEERTDGKKGVFAFVQTPTETIKVVQFNQLLAANTPVTIFTDEKGYRQLRMRSLPNF